MAAGKNSFVLYADLIDLLDGVKNENGEYEIEPMSDEDAGILFKTILRYVNDLNPKVPSNIAQSFSFIRKQLKIDLKKYEEQCERINRINEERKRKKEEQSRNDIVTKSSEQENDIVGDNCNLIFDNCNLINEDTKVSNKTYGQIDDVDQVHLDKKDIILKQYSEWFDMFWKAYPNKKKKKEANKWFLAKSHTHADGEKFELNEDLFKIMMNALEYQKNTKAWNKDGGKYIPYPTSWLNGEMWNDEAVKIYYESCAKHEIVWEEL